MKKIIAAIDGLKFSESTVEYAVHIARHVNAHVVGVFLEDFTYHSYKMHELVGNESMLLEKREFFDQKDKELRRESVDKFKNMCGLEGISFSVHHNKNIALTELLHESIYADLLIIDSSQTLTHYEEDSPTRFIRDLLSEAQCPVLVVPKQFKPIDKLTLLYDGEPSSLFAIRMFSYILPALRNLPTEVVSVVDEQRKNRLLDNRLFKEFMKRHYTRAGYTVLEGDAKQEIINQLIDQGRNMVIVLGAYRRGMVSRWLKPSMADALISELRVPLFIAHNK